MGQIIDALSGLLLVLSCAVRPHLFRWLFNRRRRLQPNGFLLFITLCSTPSLQSLLIILGIGPGLHNSGALVLQIRQLRPPVRGWSLLVLPLFGPRAPFKARQSCQHLAVLTLGHQPAVKKVELSPRNSASDCPLRPRSHNQDRHEAEMLCFTEKLPVRLVGNGGQVSSLVSVSHHLQHELHIF